MLLQYLGKLKNQIYRDIQPMWKKMQAYCILIASNVVIRPQILIFSGLKWVSFPKLIANKIFHVTVFWLFTFAINLWHRKFVTADVTAMFVNNQHGIQRRGQCFNKEKFVFEGYTAKRLTDEFPEKRWTKHVVNKLLKRCGKQAQLTSGQI